MATLADRRRATAAAGKARRKKIFVILGICVLVVVLAIQVPKTLDLLSSDTPAAAPVAAPSTSTTPTTTVPAPRALQELRGSGGRDPFAVASTESADPE